MRKIQHFKVAASINVGIILLLLTIACAQPKKDKTIDETVADDYVVIAYYANFAGKRPVKNITFKGINYIYHSFLYPDSLKLIDTSAINQDIKELIDSANSNHVKVMVSLGPDHNALKHYKKISSDSATTEKFANILLKFCKDNGYIGVDLDWEKPEIPDIFNYERFVRIINRVLKTKSLLFSITLPGQYYKTNYLNYKVLSENVDWINIMTYDYGNIDTLKCMHSTPLADIKADVDSFLNHGVPKHKLVLGLAFYGRKYVDVNCFSIGSYGDREATVYPIDSILPKLIDASWAKFYDEQKDVPFMYNAKRHQLISYESKASLILKCEFAKKKLKGVMYWAMDYDAKDYNKSYQKIVGESIMK